MKDLLQHIKIKDFTTEAGALISEMNLSYQVFGQKLGKTSHCETVKIKIWVRGRTGHLSICL